MADRKKLRMVTLLKLRLPERCKTPEPEYPPPSSVALFTLRLELACTNIRLLVLLSALPSKVTPFM